MGRIIKVYLVAYFTVRSFQCPLQRRYHKCLSRSRIGRFLTMLKFRIIGAVGEVRISGHSYHHLRPPRLT